MSFIISKVLYIGQSKKLNNYYAPRAKYIENGKGRVAGSDAARCINQFIFNLPPTQTP
jgi:hypothetical protein